MGYLDPVGGELGALAGAIPAAAIVSLTDNSGGATGNDTLVAGAGIMTVALYLELASLADGDVLTTYTPGFAGKVLSVDFAVHKAATTAAKLSSLNLEIGTTNLTGGVVALTSANATPKGVVVAGSAVTAANAFTAADTISVEASATTAFVEGAGWLLLRLQNTTVIDNLADLAAKINTLLTRLRTAGILTP